MTIVIALDGVAPGVGKSTVAERIAGSLRRSGLVVDHFREEEVLTRQACAGLASEFRASGRVAPATMLDTARRYVASLADVDVAVLDALLPFIPSLLAWRYDDEAIDAFIGRLTAVLGDTRVVLVYLDGDPVTALHRAAAREGAGWLEWLAAQVGSGPDPEAMRPYFDRRRALTLELLAKHGWELLVLDTTGTDPAGDVLEALALSVGETPEG